MLKDGQNELKYSSGDACVRAFLYLWRASMPAVIFDVDGTVTLNDIAGQAAMLIDASPTHPGVCELVCELHSRGYALVYLTSRPLLGASGIEPTRRFLFEIAVDTPSGKRMPPAALITTTHQNSLQAPRSGGRQIEAVQPTRSNRFARFSPALRAAGCTRALEIVRRMRSRTVGRRPPESLLLEPSSTVTDRAAVLTAKAAARIATMAIVCGPAGEWRDGSSISAVREHVEVTWYPSRRHPTF